ncbi:AdoMet-dependent rRNA methyltransferase SPB1 [Leucoagaricus sp. SymC.cos]|nr:AdoMet-dependent rRNA methyltransferase SPB1 [Leucoagaricus sp. SymC.cos]
MGKAQKKTGKGRLDKYYKLAKEQGYRARSAFKLIQLNKKYCFLESARCCIDLCAAPGGWLQVASKYMSVNSVIVGVDLVPIKPIPRVATFAADITTPHCRNLIRSELKDWKADVVMHDGAPNVGTAWIHDAYTQSELVLMSLKLAVEFLVKGGTFVTKVFRSVDYNNLIWVFNQLFGKVEATKPPSSRQNVSAEIFVVCREFLAPKHIDSKFLDPKHVFKELASSVDKTTGNDVQANVFHPEKKRRQRDGYADGDYTLFKPTTAANFIRGDDPVAVLGTFNKIVFSTEEEKEWLAMDITTLDVKANCEDLKVLGKGDFKTLIKWRLKLREELGLDVKTKNTEEMTEAVEVEEEINEEQQVSQELERLNAEAAARAKRKRRRANEIRSKTIQRMQLRMTAPLDIGLEQSDATLGVGQEDVFDLEETEKKLNKKAQVQWLNDDETMYDDVEDGEDNSSERNTDNDFSSGEDEDRRIDGLEATLDGLYDAYKNRLRERDAKFRANEARAKDKEREKEWAGIQAERDGSDESTDSEGGWDVAQNNKLKEDDDSSDESSDEEKEGPASKGKRYRALQDPALPSAKRQRLASTPDVPSKPSSTAARLWFSQDVFSGVDSLEGLEEKEEAESVDEADVFPEKSDQEMDQASGDDFEVVPQTQDVDTDMWDISNEDEEAAKQEKIRQFGLNTAEAVTLAQMLVNRQKSKTELINDGFNRYSLNSKDGLPSWFLDDESKHYKANIPITKEAIAALRAKQRTLDARPIKKVAEAKARKKLKAAQRLEKAMKKAEGVNETTDMTEREKANQIEKLMQKGLGRGKKVKKEVKLVVAKGVHKGIKGRPKGVKGRYTMVDSRMKKEVRAKKRRDKQQKKRKRA